MTLRRSPERTAKLAQRASDLAAQGDTRAAERITARLSKRPKRIKPRREKHETTAWAEMRARVYQEQGESCAWCRRWLPLSGPVERRMHLAHLEPLGMGRSRHDAEHPLNGRDNLAGLCSKCHVALDEMPTEERAKAIEWLKVRSLPRDGHGARRSS